MSIKFSFIQWKWGVLLAASSEKGLRGVWLGKQSTQLIDQVKKTFTEAVYAPSDRGLQETLEMLSLYEKDPNYKYQGPLDLQGTPFQKRVWNQLRTVLAPSTVTYKEVAHALGRPSAYRAVANACASNMIPLIIPCHRIVGAKDIGGYRFGVELKYSLLTHEQAMF